MSRRTKARPVFVRDGGIDDVRAVIASLSDADRAMILAPGRTAYKDLPDRLASRSVAYDGETPVGFADIWGVYGDGRVRPSPSVTVAVSPGARGRGVAREVVRDAIMKVLGRARAETGPGSGRLRRFVWRLHKDNDASAAAAVRAGFSEQEFAKPHSYRQFTLGRDEVEKKADAESERLERARAFVAAVKKMALQRKLNMFLVTDGASGVLNNGNPAVRNARLAQVKWELEHGADPYEDWERDLHQGRSRAATWSCSSRHKEDKA